MARREPRLEQDDALGYTPAPIPLNEAARLAELAALDILDTDAERRFDEITELVADVLDVPIALVSLIDMNRQWFKSACGLDARETSRDLAFCAHAILEPEILVIPDTLEDARFAGNPFVQTDPRIRFYAGAVLRGPTGHALGTFCVVDRRPRNLDARQQEQLKRFARLIEKELHHRHTMAGVRREIERAACEDPLTGLPNRRLYRDRLNLAIEGAKVDGSHVAVLLAGIQRFHVLATALGRQGTEELLVEVGRRLRSVTEPRYTVARTREDVFGLLVPFHGEKVPTLERLLADLRDVLGETVRIGAEDVQAAIRIGASVYPEDGADAETLIQCARSSLREPPEVGSEVFYRFHSSVLTTTLSRQFQVEQRLRVAIASEALSLVYQPVVDLADGRIQGVEALVRWTDPDLGVVSPVEFIPVAEASGLIHPLGRWVFRRAVEQARAWRDAGLQRFTVAINLSRQQLVQEGFDAWVADVLDEAGVEPSRVELEVTESAVLHDMDRAIRTMDALSAAGVHFHIDDFGTGYSSLSNLQRLPLHKLKLDRAFVKDLTEDGRHAALTFSIIDMAHKLGLFVVAEGIETGAQLRMLRAFGCDAVQGFLLSRPLDPRAVHQLVTEHGSFSLDEAMACREPGYETPYAGRRLLG